MRTERFCALCERGTTTIHECGTISTMAKSKKKPPELLLQILPLLVVLGVCLVLIGIVALQAMRSKNAPHYYSATTWHAETARGFFDSCVYTAKRPGSGIGDKAAKMYCGCDIDALQAIYKSDSELSHAEKDWVEKGYPTEVVSAMRNCAARAHIPLNV